MKNYFWMVAGIVLLMASACNNDDDASVDEGNKNFTITIENAFPQSDYFYSAALLDAALAPGEEKIISFNAAEGQYLSFATMFVKSNDLFYAPDTPGLKLYTNGNPLLGDISDMIKLWDAGTEVNQMPGTGSNQPQNAPGARNEENRNVGLEDDTFTYPSVDSILQINLSHDGGTRFTMSIKNISNTASLETPLSPGVLVIHDAAARPIFTPGSKASAQLTLLAEEGQADSLQALVDANAGVNYLFAPGTYEVGTSNSIFTIGQPATEAFEKLAEDGDASGYSDKFERPVGSGENGPIASGGQYSFSFSAEPGDLLSLASMLVQTNDWVFALDKVALFNGEAPISGDLSSSIILLDAGTEQNEVFGIGENQPPRQSGNNVGEAQNGNVSQATDAAIKANIKISIVAE